MQSSISPHRLIASRPVPPALIDVAIAAAALAGSLVVLGHGFGASHHGSELDLLSGMLAVAATVPLVVSLRAPLLAFVLTAAASALAAAFGYALGIPLGPTAALYLLAASRTEASWWSPRTFAAVMALFVAYLVAAGAGEGRFPSIELLHVSLAWAGAWFAGDRTRLLRERMGELAERATQAERGAERERRLAIAEERARIARDLHDSAGHAINLIAVRAGAARLRHAADPDRSLAALEAIEGVARQTAAEIDQIVHSLRDTASTNGDPVTPPGLASLDTLVAHHAQAGLDVTVRRSGSPRQLAHACDQAAYRILQEALTNATRYGTGAATIELDYRDTAVELAITNPVPDRGGQDTTGGHGLIGMRERALLLGGALDARRENGAFRVSARIPYAGRRR